MTLTSRIGIGAIAAVVVIVLGVLVFSGGDDNAYHVKFRLDNAKGLRDGSLVTVGGAEIGTVKVTIDKASDDVTVDARLDPGKGPVGKNVKAYITSVNLLGSKRLELDKGNVNQPLASGSMVPQSRVVESTDLDQVLDVLSPDVRSRLGVLLGEAGAATVGRKADLGLLIGTLPPTVHDATTLLNRLVTDNHTLGDLVVNSDQFIGELNDHRADLNALVDSAGQASVTFAEKRAELRATLAKAPRTLKTLQTFLAELQRTTVPLGPAARELSATAPQINSTLAQLEPFRKAAVPTLDEVKTVSPTLTKLAVGATPVLKRATPTVNRLAVFSRNLKPISDILDLSVDNLLAVVDNWSHAVQFRDGLSHVFRGEVGITQQTLESLINLATRPATSSKKKKSKVTIPVAAKPDDKPQTKTPDKKDPVKSIVDGLGLQKTVDNTLGTVDKTLKGVLQGTQGLLKPKQEPQQQPTQNKSSDLLDFLLKP